MDGFRCIMVRQPQPNDIVDNPVRVCGIGAPALRAAFPRSCILATVGCWRTRRSGLEATGHCATFRPRSLSVVRTTDDM